MPLNSNREEAIAEPSVKFPVSIKTAAIVTVLLVIFNMVANQYLLRDYIPDLAKGTIAIEFFGFPFYSAILAPPGCTYTLQKIAILQEVHSGSLSD